MRWHLLAPIAALVAAFASAVPASASDPAGGCHEYEGAPVSLRGTIRLETFPGPPRFLNVYRGDEPVSEFVLELDQPFCVKGEPDREAGALPALAEVTRVQALMPAELPIEAELLGRLGERVWLHGRLIPPASRYHYLPVLIQARRANPGLFERPEAPAMPGFAPVPGVPLPETAAVPD